MPHTARELKDLAAAGQNVMALTREQNDSESNAERDIEVAYDLQAGSYVKAMAKPDVRAIKDQYTEALVDLIQSLTSPTTVLEAGVGEATTLTEVARGLGVATAKFFGFDISWSRIDVARRWVKERGVDNAHLCVASLFHLPYADDSIDVVYTSHSIEPNGGHEEPILQELFRVTRRFLVLLEPGYELAPPEAQARMDSFGYCRGLKQTAEKLGYRVQRHELFGVTLNPLNPTALTIIEKDPSGPLSADVLACPRHHTELVPYTDGLYSPEALSLYPSVGGIPCLRLEHAILASHLDGESA